MGSEGLREVPHAAPLVALRGLGSSTRSRSFCPGQEELGKGRGGLEAGEDRGTPRKDWPRPSWPSPVLLPHWRHLASSGRTLSDALSGPRTINMTQHTLELASVTIATSSWLGAVCEPLIARAIVQRAQCNEQFVSMSNSTNLFRALFLYDQIPSSLVACTQQHHALLHA